ncbi:MAG TPA: tetratricopeptide repeat protein, partial [Bacteroidaceae bacterium]|nr:tetratricopeptide repeat protein [Bacteroidaceae bacterium]
MRIILKYVEWFSLLLLFLLYLPVSVHGRNDSFTDSDGFVRKEYLHTSPDVVFQEAQQLYLAGRALRDTVDMHSALIRLGRLYLDKFDPDEALNYFNRSLTLVKDMPAFICQEVESQYYIGQCYYKKHAFDLAMNWWKNGEKILSSRFCPTAYGRILTSVAEYNLLMGDFSIARDQLMEALDVISQYTEPELAVQIHTILGQVYHRLGDYDSSMISYHNAIDICYFYKIKSLLPLPLIHLSLTHCYYNEFDNAADNLQIVISIADEYEDLNAKGMAFSIMGIVEFIFQNYDRGLEYCNRALDIFEKTDNLIWKAQTYEHLFSLYMGIGDMNSAERAALNTLEIRRKTGSVYGLGESYENLGLLYLAINEYEKAKSANLKSLEFRKEIKYRHGMASSLHKVGRTYFALGNMDSAMFYYNEALRIADTLGVKRGKAAILFSMSQVQEY